MTRITLINGDGIGPEISDAVVKIIDASGLKIDWDVQTAGADVIEKEGVPLPNRVLTSIRANQSCLKSSCYNTNWKRFPFRKCSASKRVGFVCKSQTL